jgi:hypothetical protein
MKHMIQKRRLLKALGSCDPDMRCHIPRRYKELFQIDVKELMKKERGNSDFGILLQFLAVDPVHAECDMKAIQTLGAHEKIIFSIIGARSNSEIRILKVSWTCVKKFPSTKRGTLTYDDYHKT